MDVAITEIDPSTFLLIQVGYIIGGLISLALAATGFGQSSVGSRVINALVGVACIGYAIYLFTATEVIIFWYVMLLPVILLVQAIAAFFKGRQGARAS